MPGVGAFLLPDKFKEMLKPLLYGLILAKDKAVTEKRRNERLSP